MSGRKYLALVALVVLVGTAGCSTILGPGEPDPKKISENATYDWQVDANATYNVTRNQYQGIIRIQNQSTIELFTRDALGTESRLDVRGLQFQYPNGTVTNVSAQRVNFTGNGKRTVVNPPARVGTLAFTMPRTGKQFNMPTFVQGTYEVTLPQNARVGVPILAQVSPRDYSTTLEDGRVTIRWENVQTRSISARYYLARDLLLFGGLFGILVVAAGVGALYYLRQIRELERRREEVGLDVEDEEDDDVGDSGPPPGMR
jgi:hypothetical protein